MPEYSVNVHELVPYTPSDVAAPVGDIDGDGDEDVVRDRSVQINDANLLFHTAACALPGTAAHAFANTLEDVDGDGDLDLARITYEGFEWWANDGAGCFGAAPQERVDDSYPSSFALGDFDGDQDLDVVLAREYVYDNCFAPELYLNDGSGTFTFATGHMNLQSWIACLDFIAVAAGDIDADGDLDLYFRGGYGEYDPGDKGSAYTHPDLMLVNDGTAHFTIAWGQFPQSFSFGDPALVDVDGDGDLDLMSAGVRLQLNDGTGDFNTSSAAIPAPYYCAKQQFADFDSDGDVDVLLTTVCDNVSPPNCIWMNSGSGGFVLVPDVMPVTWRSLAVVDADGDADVDIATESSLLVNTGSFGFVDPSGALPPDDAWIAKVVAGDVDGDRDIDLVFGGNERLRLRLGNDAGTWTDATGNLGPNGGFAHEVALIDIDNDGDLDLLVVQQNASSPPSNRLALNDGHGTFTPAPSLWPNVGVLGTLAWGDVDADGDLDVLCGQQLFFNDGTGHLAVIAGTWPTVPPHYGAFEFADVDGDFDLDAVSGGYELGWVRNDGSGNFTLQANMFPPGLIGGLKPKLGDLDGDGDLDMVGNAWGNNHVHWLFANDGHGVFTDWPSALPTLNPISGWVVALDDMDDDGDLDLVANESLEVLVNDGGGQFSAAGSLLPGFWDRLGVMIDLDGDGDRDAVTAGGLGGTVVTNLTRHLAWRTLPRIGHMMELELHGKPNEQFVLLGSHGRAYVPFGSAGVLKIDRSQLALRRYGHFDAQGRALVTHDVANDPLLAGTSLYWQALIANPRKLTNLEITTFVDL